MPIAQLYRELYPDPVAKFRGYLSIDLGEGLAEKKKQDQECYSKWLKSKISTTTFLLKNESKLSEIILQMLDIGMK